MEQRRISARLSRWLFASISRSIRREHRITLRRRYNFDGRRWRNALSSSRAVPFVAFRSSQCSRVHREKELNARARPVVVYVQAPTQRALVYTDADRESMSADKSRGDIAAAPWTTRGGSFARSMDHRSVLAKPAGGCADPARRAMRPGPDTPLHVRATRACIYTDGFLFLCLSLSSRFHVPLSAGGLSVARMIIGRGYRRVSDVIIPITGVIVG